MAWWKIVTAGVVAGVAAAGVLAGEGVAAPLGSAGDDGTAGLGLG